MAAMITLTPIPIPALMTAQALKACHGVMPCCTMATPHTSPTKIKAMIEQTNDQRPQPYFYDFALHMSLNFNGVRRLEHFVGVHKTYARNTRHDVRVKFQSSTEHEHGRDEQRDEHELQSQERQELVWTKNFNAGCLKGGDFDGIDFHRQSFPRMSTVIRTIVLFLGLTTATTPLSP